MQTTTYGSDDLRPGERRNDRGHEVGLTFAVERSASAPQEYRGIFSVAGVDLFTGSPGPDKYAARKTAEREFAELLAQVLKGGDDRG